MYRMQGAVELAMSDLITVPVCVEKGGLLSSIYWGSVG